MSFFSVSRLVSTSARGAFLLFFISTVARALSALATLVLAYGFAADANMDRYMVLAMLTAAFSALTASALPGIVSAHLSTQSNGPSERAVQNSFARTLIDCRRWSKALAVFGASTYLLSLPLLSWILDSQRTAQGRIDLGLLLLPGAVVVALAPLLAVEHTLLQSRGLARKAAVVSSSSTSIALASAALATATHFIAWSALGLALGTLVEWCLVRRLNREPAASAAHLETSRKQLGLPWRPFLVLTAATAAVFCSSLVDQAVLAHQARGMQALWGLAARAPSFITLSLFAVVGMLSTDLVSRSAGASCPQLPGQASRLARRAVIASCTAMGALALAAHPLTRLLYERGAFTAVNTQQVAQATRAAVWAFIAYPPLAVILRTATAQRKFRWLGASAAAFFLLKVSLASWACQQFGVLGIAGTTGFAMSVQLGVLWWQVARLPSA